MRADERRTTRKLLCQSASGEELSDTAIRPSVPWRSCLGYRHACCLQLNHRRPPEMRGLRTRPRMDVDPPRFLPPSNCHRQRAYRLAASGAIPSFCKIFIIFLAKFSFRLTKIFIQLSMTAHDAAPTGQQQLAGTAVARSTAGVLIVSCTDQRSAGIVTQSSHRGRKDSAASSSLRAARSPSRVMRQPNMLH